MTNEACDRHDWRAGNTRPCPDCDKEKEEAKFLEFVERHLTALESIAKSLAILANPPTTDEWER